MNKNKLIVLLVLLIAVVGLSMSSATAKTTSKTKIVKVQPKFNKDTIKRSGKYIIKSTKVKYSTDQWVYLSLEKGKNKYVKANKYSSKVYYKLNGKSYKTKWVKKSSKDLSQSHKLPLNAKVSKVEVKVPSS